MRKFKVGQAAHTLFSPFIIRWCCPECCTWCGYIFTSFAKSLHIHCTPISRFPQ